MSDRPTSSSVAGTFPKVLVLHDGNRGHIKQSQAVLEIIRKVLTANRDTPENLEVLFLEVIFRHPLLKAFVKVVSQWWANHCFFQRMILPSCVAPPSLNELMNLNPDLILSCGASTSAMNLMLKKHSHARSIALLNPGALIRKAFDLVIVPRHDLDPYANIQPNLLITDLTPNLITPESVARWRNAPGIEPKSLTLGLLMGGHNRTHRLTAQNATAITEGVLSLCSRLPAKLLVTTSRRTPPRVEMILEQAFRSQTFCKIFVSGKIGSGSDAVERILGISDLVLVSGDSISMVSEAVSSGRPVVVFMPRKIVPFRTKYERFIGQLVADGLVTKVVPEEISRIDLPSLIRQQPISPSARQNPVEDRLRDFLGAVRNRGEK
ncbi:MAG: mitochondrial fission ELM1 family protein [Planctomycetes bacterium]|nr:mitochondrial fission ELM1 family protein [Planctomycetota bacterium]